MRRVILLLTLSALFVPGRADALTLRDIVELSRAGLGDEVLLALIEVDRPVFNIDADTLKSLKSAGVSERIIVAVVRSGRPPTAPVVAELVPVSVPVLPSAPAPEPQVVVIDHHNEQPRVREIAFPVAVPVYIPVVWRDREHDRTRDREHARPGASEPKPAEPVYWGWGGKRRPDAWKDK